MSNSVDAGIIGLCAILGSMTMRLLDAAGLSACGIGPADRLLVGLSGGADSVALLHSLCRCRAEGLIAGLDAAHLIHGIRAESAEEDAAFCAALCRSWDVPLRIGRADAPAFSRERDMTLEQAARVLRYAFLRRCAGECGADCIAVAHHADDQAETLMLHLMRGSGRTGLAGMRPRCGDIARPLLGVWRRDVEAYLAENGISYRTDETNAEPNAARNRVRHELLPLMESFNPRVREALIRLGGHMAADEDYFSALAGEALREARLARGYDRGRLSALSEPVRARTLRRLVGELQDGDFSEADIRRVEALLTAKTGSCIELKNGMAAWTENEAILLGKPPRPQSFETPFVAWGETALPAGRIRSVRTEAFFKPENGYTACVDAAAIPAGAVLRTRRDGDRFHPFGAPGGRLLSDFLTDRKCPRARRDMPLLCDGTEVLWVAGYMVSERLRVGAGTESLMKICYEEEEDYGTDAG